MRMVNMHEAKTHLSQLVDQAAKGEPFVIAKAGKPWVKVIASLPQRSWLNDIHTTRTPLKSSL